ncbi:hypothetical protein [Pleurocapsa sp. PCC 7327]|uniref:hypothetical protein n=1 Tax=Pleurocapsa sp. PCC 7327 TaxID=118163 RepID=UPI00163E66DD|nr:hypothetical protein [Pleurocapsa sp. PCC 7327]
MMRHRLLTGIAIALLLVLGSGAIRNAWADRADDFTRFSQAQPECKGDPDDCE